MTPDEYLAWANANIQDPHARSQAVLDFNKRRQGGGGGHNPLVNMQPHEALTVIALGGVPDGQMDAFKNTSQAPFSNFSGVPFSEQATSMFMGGADPAMQQRFSDAQAIMAELPGRGIDTAQAMFQPNPQLQIPEHIIKQLGGRVGVPRVSDGR